LKYASTAPITEAIAEVIEAERFVVARHPRSARQIGPRERRLYAGWQSPARPYASSVGSFVLTNESGALRSPPVNDTGKIMVSAVLRLRLHFLQGEMSRKLRGLPIGYGKAERMQIQTLKQRFALT